MALQIVAEQRLTLRPVTDPLELRLRGEPEVLVRIEVRVAKTLRERTAERGGARP
jgi:hypothetical protein